MNSATSTYAKWSAWGICFFVIIQIYIISNAGFFYAVIIVAGIDRQGGHINCEYEIDDFHNPNLSEKVV